MEFVSDVRANEWRTKVLILHQTERRFYFKARLYGYLHATRQFCRWKMRRRMRFQHLGIDISAQTAVPSSGQYSSEFLQFEHIRISASTRSGATPLVGV
jgi:hypothetical protein